MRDAGRVEFNEVGGRELKLLLENCSFWSDNNCLRFCVFKNLFTKIKNDFDGLRLESHSLTFVIVQNVLFCLKIIFLPTRTPLQTTHRHTKSPDLIPSNYSALKKLPSTNPKKK
jgi:hypothetical protein